MVMGRVVGEGGGLRHAACIEAAAFGVDSSRERVVCLTRAHESSMACSVRARVVELWGELRDAGSVPRPCLSPHHDGINIYLALESLHIHCIQPNMAASPIVRRALLYGKY